MNLNITTKKTNLTRPTLYVLIDNSESIEFINQNNAVKEIYEKINESKLTSKFEVEYYSFGKQIKVLDSLNFIKNETNIYNSLLEINGLSSSNNDAIILITDGIQTIGVDYQFLKSKTSVYPIIVGDTVSFTDISIKQINANKFSSRNNIFPVEIIIDYLVNEKVSSKLIIENKGKIIFSKNISFDSKNTSKIINAQIEAKDIGNQFYKVSIIPISEEINTINNSQNFSIEITNDKTNILLLSDIIHPDISALKRSIESNNQTKVTLSNSLTDIGLINKYQLFILYQPGESFKKIVKVLLKENKNYFLITGSKTDWGFINDNLKIINKNYLKEVEDYSARFNPNYLNFQQNNIGFEDFPPLKDMFGDINFTSPNQSLLYQNIQNIATDKPILATSDLNNQKSVFLFGEGIWKWRINSYLKYNSFEKFDNFIGKIIQYASLNNKAKRLDVDVKSLFNANEPVEFFVNYVDKNYQFDSRLNITITIVNKSSKIRYKYPLHLRDNTYYIEIDDLPDGEYTYEIFVDKAKMKKSGVFKISKFNLEKQFYKADKKRLQILAKNSQGKLYNRDNIDNLINDLSKNPLYKTIQSTSEVKKTLVDWQFLMYLIIVLLSTEWIIRKYNGNI